MYIYIQTHRSFEQLRSQQSHSHLRWRCIRHPPNRANIRAHDGNRTPLPPLLLPRLHLPFILPHHTATATPPLEAIRRDIPLNFICLAHPAPLQRGQQALQPTRQREQPARAVAGLVAKQVRRILAVEFAVQPILRFAVDEAGEE